MKKHFAVLGAILICAAGVAAGCGSSSNSSNSSSSGGSTSGSSGSVQSGGTVTPTEATNAKGNVTWCIGKDTTGAFSQVVSLYNQSHPGVHVKLLELPTSADQQRTQLTQRLQAKSSECDVLGMDVIWTAEFASQGWLKDVTPAIQARQTRVHPVHAEHREDQRQVLGSPVQHERRAPLLQRQEGVAGPDDLAAGPARWPRPTVASASRVRPTRG